MNRAAQRSKTGLVGCHFQLQPGGAPLQSQPGFQKSRCEARPHRPDGPDRRALGRSASRPRCPPRLARGAKVMRTRPDVAARSPFPRRQQAPFHRHRCRPTLTAQAARAHTLWMPGVVQTAGPRSAVVRIGKPLTGQRGCGGGPIAAGGGSKKASCKRSRPAVPIKDGLQFPDPQQGVTAGGGCGSCRSKILSKLGTHSPRATAIG